MNIYAIVLVDQQKTIDGEAPASTDEKITQFDSDSEVGDTEEDIDNEWYGTNSDEGEHDAIYPNIDIVRKRANQLRRYCSERKLRLNDCPLADNEHCRCCK
jgi:hypothetical protein